MGYVMKTLHVIYYSSKNSGDTLARFNGQITERNYQITLKLVYFTPQTLELLICLTLVRINVSLPV